MNIAVVTREFAPLTKNGGIGTAVRGLCEDLASHGHSLTVYYTGRPGWRIWAFAADACKQGMNFKPIVSLSGLLLRDPVRRCRKAYAVLSRTRHDVYIFHEFMADGLFCLRAHRQKGAFAHSRLGVVTHGSALWVDEGNDCVAQDGRRRHLYAMEQECCELADFVVSPSRYLIGWMRDKGWHLPEATHCILNFLPSPCKAPSTPTTLAHDFELVFFGRLEERKGVRVFCEALAQLPRARYAGLRVTFLGSEAGFRAEDIRVMLQHPMEAGLHVTFLTSLDSQGALEYLRGGQRLAVMPSLRENSPCTVAECLEHSIPFIASSEGGGKELVREEDRAVAFCPPDALALASKLDALLRAGTAPLVQPAYTRAALSGQWQELLQTQAACVQQMIESTGVVCNEERPRL